MNAEELKNLLPEVFKSLTKAFDDTADLMEETGVLLEHIQPEASVSFTHKETGNKFKFTLAVDVIYSDESN